MKHRYEFVVGTYIVQAVTLSGDHDGDAEKVLVWALREALHMASVTGGTVQVRHRLVNTSDFA